MLISKSVIQQFRMFARALLGNHTRRDVVVEIHVDSTHLDIVVQVAGYSLSRRVTFAEADRDTRVASFSIPWSLFEEISKNGYDVSLAESRFDSEKKMVAIGLRGPAIRRQKAIEWSVPNERFLRVEIHSPVLPHFCENLSNASMCTDESSLRYSLGCIQLARETYSMNATDGKQAIAYAGYQFQGVSDEILIRNNPLFRRQDFRKLGSVHAGVRQVKEQAPSFVISNDLWQITVPVETEGRFPQIPRVFPDVRVASNRVNFTKVNRSVLKALLKDLPGAADPCSPVHLVLGKSVEIIGMSTSGEGECIGLTLAQASHIGGFRRISFDRQFLEKALDFGFDRLFVMDGMSPMVMSNAFGRLTWMPLTSSLDPFPTPVSERLVLNRSDVESIVSDECRV